MKFSIPILFQIYNSLESSIIVFKEIRKVQPLYLYIAQDGFRSDYPREESQCLHVRNAVLKMIDWDCELITLFRDHNLGPGKGTADAIKWFFGQVEYGIVLEHDCLPHPDFFEYCSILLEKYKNNDRIKLINGSNYQMDKKYTKYSYYFTASGQLWGWASWRRTFENYSQDIGDFDFDLLKKDIESTFKTKRVQDYWKGTYIWILEGIVNTWDYQLMFLIWKEKGLVIAPNVNLISNIGFGENAIHCKEIDSNLSNAKLENILPLNHPKKIKHSYRSDLYYHDHYLSWGYEKVSPVKQFKRKLKKVFPVLIDIKLKF